MYPVVRHRSWLGTFLQAFVAVGLLFAVVGNAFGVQDASAMKPNLPETTTWLVIRHAERDGENDALTNAGKDRTEILQQLGSILNVAAIYSTDFARTKGTVQPLADSLGQEIRVYGQATDEWLQEVRAENNGGVVLIVGHSNTAGVIAGKLAGMEPFAIGHDEYDALFVVTSNGVKSSVVRLKYGQPSFGAPFASPDKMGPGKSSKIP